VIDAIGIQLVRYGRSRTELGFSRRRGTPRDSLREKRGGIG
jgi:hypothetical protein